MLFPFYSERIVIKPKEKLLQIYACCVCEAYPATETLPASIVRNASQVKNTIFFR
jgi:hypothetical protein